jgi:uncharacterized protein (DUF1330 family)
MTVQILALVTINEDQPQALAQYLEATAPLLEAAGAQIVQRFVIGEDIVGQAPSQSVMIVNYPSRDAVDIVFQSDIYRAIAPIRDKAFSSYHVSLVAGVEAA